MLVGALTVGSLNAQCPNTPKCVFDSCYYGGDGLSESTAFQIWSKEHLEELADSVNNSTVPNPYNWSTNKYFALMNDITDTVRTVIGYSDARCFQGHFQGQNFTITLGINVPVAGSPVGLFGMVNGATILNVTTEGYVRRVGFTPVGAIVGTSRTWATPEMPTLIKNVTNNCEVSGTAYIGGIIGQTAYNTSVEFATNTGNISATTRKSHIGGIVGLGSGIVSNSTNNGKIFGDEVVGGIQGSLSLSGKILHSLNIGVVTGNKAVGGILGEVWYAPAEIFSNTNHGFIKGNNEVGGIIGYMDLGIATNNFNSGVVHGNQNVGCIVGRRKVSIGAKVINNHYDKQMCGE